VLELLAAGIDAVFACDRLGKNVQRLMGQPASALLAAVG
jgi:hypothetical protein